MQELYKALLKKKKGDEKSDPMEQNAKMGVLNDIHKMASNDLGHDIHGIKKVSVMSTDDAGMKQGLKKAQELVAHKPGHSMSDNDADDVSNDMHQESQRHKLNKHSEMTDQADGMANKMGDEEHDSDKSMEGYADGGEIEHQHDQTTEFMENGPEEMSKEWGPGRNYAQGGMIHPGQYGEAQANVVGTPHQNLQSEGMNTRYAAPTMAKEKGSARNYAEGGMVKNRFGDPHGTDAHEPTDVEHQSLQHNNSFAAAQPTINKERDTTETQKMGTPKMNSKGTGTHGTHASPDPADEYSDLEPDDLEALISHLQKFRKSAPTF